MKTKTSFLTACLALAFVSNLLAGDIPAAVSVGGKVTFTATAESDSPVVFKWSHNGAHIHEGMPLVLENVTKANAGIYTVTAGNKWGTTASLDRVILEVGSPPSPPIILPPVITAPLAAQRVEKQQSATFAVAASGTRPLRYVWRHQGRVLAGETGSTLTFAKVNPSYRGIVSVEVIGAIGPSAFSMASLDTL